MKVMNPLHTLVALTLFLLSLQTALAQLPYQLDWSRQLGTSAGDFSHSVAVDSAGGVYVTGVTNGDLAGTNQGGADAWLMKFTATTPDFNGDGI